MLKEIKDPKTKRCKLCKLKYVGIWTSVTPRGSPFLTGGSVIVVVCGQARSAPVRKRRADLAIVCAELVWCNGRSLCTFSNLQTVVSKKE